MTSATYKRAIASIAAKRLVNRALRLRKHFAGSLLRSIRSVITIVRTVTLVNICTVLTAHSELSFMSPPTTTMTGQIAWTLMSVVGIG